MNALVVSRTPGARAWIRAALGPDWTFDEAGDGLEALSLAKAQAPRLVIADESTEPYGAFGLTRELKILEDPPRVLIVLDRRQDTWLARWAGADAWLVQPVDPFELAAKATEILAEPVPLAAHEEPTPAG